jgi:hypothetical protein
MFDSGLRAPVEKLVLIGAPRGLRIGETTGHSRRCQLQLTEAVAGFIAEIIGLAVAAAATATACRNGDGSNYTSSCEQGTVDYHLLTFPKVLSKVLLMFRRAPALVSPADVVLDVLGTGHAKIAADTLEDP